MALGFSPFQPPSPGNSPITAPALNHMQMYQSPAGAAAAAAAAAAARANAMSPLGAPPAAHPNAHGLPRHIYPSPPPDIHAGAWRPPSPVSPQYWSRAMPYNPAAAGSGSFLQYAANAMKSPSQRHEMSAVNSTPPRDGQKGPKVAGAAAGAVTAVEGDGAWAEPTETGAVEKALQSLTTASPSAGARQEADFPNGQSGQGGY